MKESSLKVRAIELIWQHFLLIISLYFMTLGVALCVRSNLGSGVISAIPMVFSIAGEASLAPPLTIGGYTNIMNIFLVCAQVLVLRKQFEKIQLLQLIIGFIFGMLLDINMAITSIFAYESLGAQIVAQALGCTILAVAIAFEIRCGSVTMPGEGIQVAISRVTGQPFPKIKIIVDTVLVSLAVVAGYCFFGVWMWRVVGPGTLFAMFYVGFMVRLVSPHLGWFDKIVAYRPGFRRYIYGLARFIYPRQE